MPALSLRPSGFAKQLRCPRAATLSPIDSSGPRCRINSMASSRQHKHSRSVRQTSGFGPLDSEKEMPNAAALRTMLREWRHAPCFTNAKPFEVEGQFTGDDLLNGWGEGQAAMADWSPDMAGQKWAALVLTLHRDGRYDLRHVRSQTRAPRKPQWNSSTARKATSSSQNKPELSTLARAYSQTSERSQLGTVTPHGRQLQISRGAESGAQMSRSWKSARNELDLNQAVSTLERPMAADFGSRFSSRSESREGRRPRKRWQAPLKAALYQECPQPCFREDGDRRLQTAESCDQSRTRVSEAIEHSADVSTGRICGEHEAFINKSSQVDGLEIDEVSCLFGCH